MGRPVKGLEVFYFHRVQVGLSNPLFTGLFLTKTQHILIRMFTAHATREPPERPPGQLSRVRPETGHVRDRGPLRGVPLEEGQQGTQYNSIPVTRHIFAFQASKQITI